jgi:DNA-binding transcriptional ArsR family regulator
MGAAQGTLLEMRELKSEITGLRSDLQRFIEKANQQHIDAVLKDMRKNYGGVIANREVDTAKTCLAENMTSPCKMREQCYGVFLEFLQKTARHISGSGIPDEVVQSFREEMMAMQKKGPFARCDTCFSEVERLFEKQIDLMQSLGIYRKSAELQPSIADIPEDVIVRDILDPVANLQRFQIVKALAVQTRTFSEISQLTGLRGGNLLFHIRKLTGSGMILQRHERGDYIITEKGFRVLRALAEPCLRTG